MNSHQPTRPANHEEKLSGCPPLKVGSVVALGKADGTCPIGYVDAIDGDWVQLALQCPASGDFGAEIESHRLSEVVTVRHAKLLTPQQARELDGYIMGEDEKFFDCIPLEHFRNAWRRKHKTGNNKSALGALIDRTVPTELRASHAPPPPALDRGESQSSPPAPWESMTLKELLDSLQPPWAIEGYVRLGQFGFLIAAPTVGKSTLAASWIMSVFHGRPWCGRQTTPGSVIALVGEGRRGFSQRLAAFATAHGLVNAPQGSYLEIVDFKEPLSSALGQANMKRLLDDATAKNGHAPKFVVIDTLSSHWADSEDSAEFGAPAMRALGDLAHKHACVVLVVHHTTKSKGKTVMPELNDCRGSGTFIGNSDFVFGMCASRSGDGAVLKGLKLKDDEPPETVRLARVSVPCGTDEGGREVSAAVFRNAAVSARGEGEDEERDRKNLDADLRTLVSAMIELRTATKKDAVVTQAHMGVVRGRAVFDIAVSKGFIRNSATARKPSYVPTESAHAFVAFEASGGARGEGTDDFPH